MSLVSFPSWGLSMDDLVEREGLYYQKFTDVPFTGEIDEELKRGNYKEGQRDGTWISYHENGQLKYKGDYKNGRQEGTWIGYHENGQLHYKGEYKNGKREGTWIIYYDDGPSYFLFNAFWNVVHGLHGLSCSSNCLASNGNE